MSYKPVYLFMIIAVLGILVCCLDSVDGAETYIVDDDNGTWADFEKIQDAINASSDGDTILVYGGQYTENVKVNRTVNLIGNGSDVTTIDGDGITDVIGISASRSSVRGFNCTNSGGYPCGGIAIHSANNCTVINNMLYDNWFGVFLEDSSSRTNTIKKNMCTGNYGGMRFNMGRYNIIDSNTLTGDGISFASTPYCKVINNSFEKGGISISGGLKMKVINNTCVNTDTSWIGLSVTSSDYVTMEGNTLIDHSNKAVRIWNSDNVTVTNNTMKHCSIGIYNYRSNITQVHQNHFINNTEWGIQCKDSSVNATMNWWGHQSGPYHAISNPNGTGVNVTDNVTFDPWLTTIGPKGQEENPWIVDDDNGSWADFEKIQDAINASGDGDSIYVFNGTYYENVVIETTVSLMGNGSNDTTINGGGTGDVMLVDADLVTISHFNITNSGSDVNMAGIQVKGDNSTILENEITKCKNGIRFYYSRDNNVSNNSICYNYANGIVLSGGAHYIQLSSNVLTFNNHNGIDIYMARHNTVQGNLIANNSHGIDVDANWNRFLDNEISGSEFDGIRMIDSKNTTIKGNIFSDNNRGVYLVFHSINAIIEANEIKNSRVEGVYLNQAGYAIIGNNSVSNNGNEGLILKNSDKSTVSFNNFTSNGDAGVEMESSNNVTLAFNNFSENGGYCLNLVSGFDNNIFLNNFWINGSNGCVDDGRYSIWDNGLTGNYWSDYNGTDSNGDGIGDSLYEIGGSANAEDRYPLVDSWNGTLLNGSNGPRTWIVDDDNGSWADFEKIQDAINASSNGDTIEVYNGTYFEAIEVNITLTIIGNGSSTTTIDGMGIGNVVYMSTNNSSISGFNLTNANSTNFGSGVAVQADGCVIENNTFFNCWGIFLNRSEGCTIQDNIMFVGGVGLMGDTLDQWNSHLIDTSNLVKGRPIRYWTNLTNGTVPDDTGQVILANCSWITVKGLDINGTGYAIEIGFSDNCTLSENNITMSSMGIALFRSENITLMNNNVSDNLEVGVMLNSSWAINITQNRIDSNEYIGLLLDHSDGNTVHNNSFDDHDVLGVYLVNSSWNEVSNNSVSNNSYYGMFILNSTNNSVHDNLFDQNGYWGLVCMGSYDNTIFHNNILDSGFDPQALEDDGNNTWDNGSVGNYWSDYSGSDGDGDGIGDTSYDLNGNTWNEDRYPLMDPWNGTLPISNEVPTAIIIEISPNPAKNGSNINFIGNGSDPDGTIVRYVWASSLDGDFYNGTENTTTNDSLSVGNHTITFRVMDNGNLWSDEVSTTLTINASTPQGNQRPSAYLESISPNPAVTGEDVTFTGYGNDTDGSITQYSWSSSLDSEFYNGTSNSTNINTLSIGNHTITFRVMDNGSLWSDEITSTLTINASTLTENQRPTAYIGSISPSPSDVGETVTFSGHGNDTDGYVLQYSWSSSIDDEFYNGTENSTTFNGLSVGNHTIYFRVMDNGSAWSEADSLNLTILPLVPDPMIEESDIDLPDDVFINSTYNFTVTVSNAGQGDANNVSVEIVIGNLTFNETVDIEALSNTEIDVQWSPNETGSIQIFVQIYFDGEETNTSNNNASKFVSVWEPSMIELSVGPATIALKPGMPSVGEEVEIYVIVWNNGPGDADNVTIELWVDGNYISSYAEPILHYNYVVVEYNWTPMDAGRHSLEIRVDPDNEFNETVEDNNNATVDFEVVIPVLPELIISGSDISIYPTDPTEDDDILVNVTIWNNGTKGVVGVTVLLEIDGVEADNTTVSIPANGSRTISFELSLSEGEHNLTITVDPDGEINELQETNNRGSITFSVSESPDTTPDPSTGDDDDSYGLLTSPLFFSIIIIIIVVVLLAILLVKKKGSSRSSKGRTPSSPPRIERVRREPEVPHRAPAREPGGYRETPREEDYVEEDLDRSPVREPRHQTPEQDYQEPESQDYSYDDGSPVPEEPEGEQMHVIKTFSCPECETPIEEGSRFCDECGTYIG